VLYKHQPKAVKKHLPLLKRIFYYTSVAILFIGFISLTTAAVSHNKSHVCSNVHVEIDFSDEVYFLKEEEVEHLVHTFLEGNALGRRLCDVDFKALEEQLTKNPYITKATVFPDQKRQINVRIKQPVPLLRIINNSGVSYYLSNNNEPIPVSNNFTARVHVAVGHISGLNTTSDSSLQVNLFTFAKMLQRDSFLNALIDQIYVKPDGDWQLIPRVGADVIEYGNMDDAEKKLGQLKVFYINGLSRMGWNRYRELNVKYDGQVVAEKRDTTNL
jgi:cell division protein FtsQ